MPNPSCPLEVGSTLAGKYRIDGYIGAGGMGVVLAATHVQLGQPLAIKLLRDDLAHDPDLGRRFLREARITAGLGSEHVVRVVDLGTTERGIPYLVMERLVGIDLAALLEERGPLTERDVVHYVLQASEALAEAHGHGLVHRDLKPHNLFVIRATDGSAHVKVLDFGIAKSIGGTSDATLTGGARVLGTPRYMAPEQLRGADDLDLRADVWSIGVVLYRLVTGGYPFDAVDVPMLTAQILSDPHVPARARCAEVSEELERIIGRCLEKDRGARYASLVELARALAPLGPPEALQLVARIERTMALGQALGPTVPMVQQGPSIAAVEPGATLTMPLPERTEECWNDQRNDVLPLASQGSTKTQRRGVWWVLAVAIAVLGATSAWWWSYEETRASLNSGVLAGPIGALSPSGSADVPPVAAPGPVSGVVPSLSSPAPARRGVEPSVSARTRGASSLTPAVISSTPLDPYGDRR